MVQMDTEAIEAAHKRSPGLGALVQPPARIGDRELAGTDGG